MKSYIALLAMALLFINPLLAQDDDDDDDSQHVKRSEMPAAVTQKFQEMFPAATNAVWEKEKGNYEAEFENNGKRSTAVFDTRGTWLQTETIVRASALPGAVNGTIHSQYAGYKVDYQEEIVKATGTFYEIGLSGGNGDLELLIDDKGKVLKEKRD